MSKPRRLGQVRITHAMLTDMVRRCLLVRDTGANHYDPRLINMEDVTVVGTSQTAQQLVSGTIDLFLESPELRSATAGCDVYRLPADLRDDKP